MSDSIYARVRRNPNYQVLVRRRGRLAVVLSALVPILMVYPFVQKHFTKGVIFGAIKG